MSLVQEVMQNVGVLTYRIKVCFGNSVFKHQSVGGGGVEGGGDKKFIIHLVHQTCEFNYHMIGFGFSVCSLLPTSANLWG